MLSRLWEAFQAWSLGRQLLLVVLAPWLVLLAWMRATAKPWWITAVAVGGAAFMWLSLALASFAEDPEQTAATDGTKSTTTTTLRPSHAYTTVDPATIPTPPPPPPAATVAPVDLPPGEVTTISRVIDGDTLEVAGGERVRLIGI
ncbi:MAG TPA: hypothetical protein VK988_22570, partial [Acidimicrobiales bacterium]|nr:hypothetical protein [Acidimicrobiales bacterium]